MTDSAPHSEAASQQAVPSRFPLLWWDIVVAVVTALLGSVGIAGAVEPEGGSILVLLSPLLVFLLLYVALLRGALRRAHSSLARRRGDMVVIAIAICVLGVAAAVEPSYATLQSLVFPMLWVVMSAREAITWSAALAVSVGVGSALAYVRLGNEYAVWTATFVAVLSFGFSVVMGTWITRIHAAGERHRELAEELRKSQAETAALAQESGAAAERERLSRELHDTLTQTLAGLVMLAEQAERALAADDTARARDRVERVGSAARDAVAEARALVATTQPLGEGGLEAALERICSRFAVDTGISIECRIEALGLDRERQVVLLRAAQEGLANARRHARASAVEVTLGPGAHGGAVLRVDDNGCGPLRAGGGGSPGAGKLAGGARMEPGRPAGTVSSDAVSPAGFGLSGLSERVRAVGGDVVFEPRPGGGSRLEVRLPEERHPEGRRGVGLVGESGERT